MKITKTTLSNYRNFKDYSIDFGKEATIFIGKNGSGKTNLIAAIKQSLSFIFSKKKEEIQYDFIASSDQKVESFVTTDARYDYERESPDYSYPISIKTTAELELHKNFEGITTWEFYKENATSGLKDSLYRDANADFWNYYIEDKAVKELPVLAFFSDSYPHIKTNIGVRMQEKLDSGFPLPRNTAYYKWDEELNCTEIWLQYFSMRWKNEKYYDNVDDKKYLTEVSQKLVEFTKFMSGEVNSDDIEIASLELDPKIKGEPLVVVFKNGTRSQFIQLPQGYKRIFSIVFDIANRAYLLNSNCNPSGIVIIDELELHLHPSIAQEILNGLKTTFPNIQFIVSTHSPLVITNFKQDDNNVIYKLYEEDGVYKNIRVDDLYGIDYNSGLRDWMETPYRKYRIEELKKAYEYWQNAGNTDKVNILKDKIKKEVGENSQLYKSLS